MGVHALNSLAQTRRVSSRADAVFSSVLAPVDGHQAGDATLDEGFVDDIGPIQANVRDRGLSVVEHHREGQRVFARLPLLCGHWHAIEDRGELDRRRLGFGRGGHEMIGRCRDWCGLLFRRGIGRGMVAASAQHQEAHRERHNSQDRTDRDARPRFARSVRIALAWGDATNAPAAGQRNRTRPFLSGQRRGRPSGRLLITRFPRQLADAAPGNLTSGGDAPGMNAAVRASVRTATLNGLDRGLYRRFTGFVAGEFVELDDRAVGNIIQRGGTMLGTSAAGVPRADVVGAAERCGRMRRRQSSSGRRELSRCARAPGRVRSARVGVTGTIDNDVSARTSDRLRYGRQTALLAIDQVRAPASQRE